MTGVSRLPGRVAELASGEIIPQRGGGGRPLLRAVAIPVILAGASSAEPTPGPPSEARSVSEEFAVSWY